MSYGLPTALDVGGVRHEIRSDYRAVLDIIAALQDPELTAAEKYNVLLGVFYVERPKDIEDAIRQCYWFINCGQPESKTKTPKLMDWEQDFQLVAGAINITAGMEVRAVEYMHWWTFVGYYMNIGDSMFAQVVSIRRKLQKGIKLDKEEREFHCVNRELIDLRIEETPEEAQLVSLWLGGGQNG